MPPKRRPLRVIDHNIKSRREISPYTRGLIVGARNQGVKLSELSQQFQLPISTIETTIQKAPTRPHGRSLPRTGRPPIASEQAKRRIVRYVNKTPFATYSQIQRELHLDLSATTIRRLLQDYGIKKWLAKKRPLLTEETAQQRLQWCQKHRNWSVKQWSNVLFSDECSVERGAGHRRRYVFRKSYAAFDKDKVQTQNKSRGLRVMIWAAISVGQRSELMVMRRDLSSKKEGYTAESYIDTLYYALPQLLRPNMLFQQDNAPIHTARKAKAFLRRYRVQLLEEWPPYSPDLNPIEHVWAILKEQLYQLFPDIELWTGSENSLSERIEDALVHAWSTIDQQLIDNCVNSMPQRIDAVIAANGWYTKY